MEPGRRDDDEQLLDDLRDALRAAGPLDAALAAGRAAYCWLSVDEELELAALVFDSRLDEAAVTRANAVVRLLVFESESVGIEVEVVDGSLVGHIAPAAAGEVELVSADGPPIYCSEVDEFGCFTIPLIDVGPARLRYHADETEFVTEWIGRWG